MKRTAPNKNKRRQVTFTGRRVYVDKPSFTPIYLLLTTVLTSLFIQFWFTSSPELVSAYAPAPTSTPTPEPTVLEPTTTPKQAENPIEAYIEQVFGAEAENALKILECENKTLNPNAKNYNRNGSIDEGIFQINSVHKQSDMTDYKKNIEFAYKLWKKGGWSQWSCSHVIGVTPFYLK